jgi:AcrR family transcriptional regulator
MSESSNDPIGSAGWRTRTLERSLERARERALDRGERFILVATELIQEKGLDFTLQDVVNKTRSSFRAFYQHFKSKDELLLAVFEEMIHTAVAELRSATASSETPLEQLREFVTGLFELSSGTPSSRALAIYHLQLAENRPEDFRFALRPMLDELEALISQAAQIGAVRADIEARKLASLLVQTVVISIHMSLLGAELDSTPTTADELWSFCCIGMGTSTVEPARVRARGNGKKTTRAR